LIFSGSMKKEFNAEFNEEICGQQSQFRKARRVRSSTWQSICRTH
jgi:hypothetical protein